MSESKEAAYTREVKDLASGKQQINYKNNGKLVAAPEVPEDVKVSLENLEAGAIVDVNGLVIEKKESAPDNEGDINTEAETKETELSEEDQAAQEAATKDVEKVAKTNELPKVKVVKDDTVVREDEQPGGSQEPVVAAPTIAIDSVDDVDDTSGLDVEEQDRISRTLAGRESDEAGMGFPRKNGKTVDVFDGKTPHTHVRYVAGVMVPLTKENHDNKSDSEIIDKLRKLGKL